MRIAPEAHAIRACSNMLRRPACQDGNLPTLDGLRSPLSDVGLEVIELSAFHLLRLAHTAGKLLDTARFMVEDSQKASGGVVLRDSPLKLLHGLTGSTSVRRDVGFF